MSAHTIKLIIDRMGHGRCFIDDLDCSRIVYAANVRSNARTGLCEVDLFFRPDDLEVEVETEEVEYPDNHK